MRKLQLALLLLCALLGFVASTTLGHSAPPCWSSSPHKVCLPSTSTSTMSTTQTSTSVTSTTSPTTTTVPPTTSTVATTTIAPTTTTTPAPSPTPSYLFDDEFDGLAGVGPNPIWWITPWCSTSPDDQESCYDPSNAFLDGNGHLVLRVSAGTMGRAYDGARVQTFQEGSWPPKTVFFSVSPPARIEARVKFGGGAGVWGGVWANGVSSSAVEELDVQEFRGAHPTLDTCHVHGWGGLSLSGGATIDTGTDLSAGWHVYWADYNTSSVTFGVDALTCATLPAVNQPIGLRLSNVVGVPGTWGGEGGPPPASALPADMLIDYVRVTAQG